MKGALSFGTDRISRKGLIDTIHQFVRGGVMAFRFERQVPPTPDYPEGVKTTQWLNLSTYTPRQISNLIGGMMTPGVDYLRNMIILEDDISKLPPTLKKQIYKKLGV